MDLRELISQNKSQEFLWTLVIESGWVQAGIWTVDDGCAKVISVSSVVPWEKEEELITSADTALSSAVQVLPADAKEPNKVVFGVSASWVESGQIKPDRLEILRKLCDKLTLKPSGFVTIPEAISFYIKSTEGSPLNAVLISPGKELVDVSLYKLGTLVGTTSIARSVSLMDDLQEGLSRFNLNDAMPSRFIVFGGKDNELEDAKQVFLNGSWEGGKIKFLHTPKVEILSSNQKVEAVSLGGAIEIANVTEVKLELSAMPDNNEAISYTDEKELESDELNNIGFAAEQDVVELGGTQNESKAKEGLSNKKDKVMHYLNKAKVSTSRVFGKFLPFVQGGKKPIIVGGGAFIFVVILLFAFWWFYPKATVTIFISPQKLDERVTFTANTSTSNINIESKVIPGRTVTLEQSGDKTATTTGTKLVGEKAKGEVEIKNRLENDIDIDSDTKFVASNGLAFVPESSVSIPAATDIDNPGVATVKVVADDIGSEYNLPSGELFKVGNNSKVTVAATAKGDFGGGSSRQIQAVSKEDQDRLLENLENELREKASDALKISVSSDEFFIDGSLVTSVSSQTFSGKVGDEAAELKLTLSVDAKGVAVSKANLFELSKSVLNEKVPDGYILRETQIEYEFELADRDDDSEESEEYLLEGDLTANLLPEINTEEIVKNIAGKYPPLAEEYLNRIPGFVRASMSISPRFPGRLGTLPHTTKNISIEIAADK